MKKIRNYSMLLFAACLCVFLNGCEKGGPVVEPQFGFLSISGATETTVTIKHEDDDGNFAGGDVAQNMLAGPNRFRFYESSIILLDTVLIATPYYNKPYVVFKPNSNTPIRVYDTSFNGYAQEGLPENGSIKLSMANFSEKYPGKVNVYITTSTIIDFKSQEIQIAEFPALSTQYTPFHTVKLGTTINAESLEHDLMITLKNAETNEVLLTTKLTLPFGAGKGSKNLPYTVYMVYISGGNVPKIMMNR